MTLKSLFKPFEDSSLTAFKVGYHYEGNAIRTDYVMTLSSYFFKLKEKEDYPVPSFSFNNIDHSYLSPMPVKDKFDQTSIAKVETTDSATKLSKWK